MARSRGSDGDRPPRPRQASAIAAGLVAGWELVHDTWFDTVTVVTGDRTDEVIGRHGGADAISAGRRRHVGITCDQTTDDQDIDAVLEAFGAARRRGHPFGAFPPDRTHESLPHPPGLPSIPIGDRDAPLSAPLSDKDLALDRTMIPLGSCTMKLNATTEMIPITWPGFADIHPFVPGGPGPGLPPADRGSRGVAGGDHRLRRRLAAAQRRVAGRVGRSAGHSRVSTRRTVTNERTVCLIPSSAHGTNAASAVMAGFEVVVVACDDDGNVDVADLEAKLDEHGDRVGALMVTYPSTHGVFEEAISEICERVHDAGGQVYVDGANLNALVGIAKPGRSEPTCPTSTCTRRSRFRTAVAVPGSVRSASVPSRSLPPRASDQRRAGGRRTRLGGPLGFGRHPADSRGRTSR
jgi:glycine dehydrogenase